MDWSLSATIAAPIIALFIGAALNRVLERRPKLISYLGHVSAFKLHDEKETQVFTHSIVVRNAGHKPASNVRIGHNVLPDFQIIPAIKYDVLSLNERGTEIVIPILVPGEQITVSYLYFPPLTWNRINSYTKSDEGFAKVLNVLPTPQLPKWSVRVMQFLILLGIISCVYLLIKLGVWLYKLSQVVPN